MTIRLSVRDFLKVSKHRFFARNSIAAIIFAAVLLIVDLLNLPSKFASNWNYIYAVITSAAMLILIIALIKMQVFQLFKVRSFNILDNVLGIVLGSLFFYSIGISILMLWALYKMIILCSIFALVVTLITLRNIMRFRAYQKLNLKNTKTFDLADFYDNIPILTEQNKPILISEREVTYDLLGRKQIANHLCSSIAAASSESAFVIGLKGSWGSGKSTLLAITKEQILKQKNSGYILVSDFDPWLYETPQAVLSAMFDAILTSAGIKYSKGWGMQTARKIYEILTQNSKGEKLGELFSLLKEDENDQVKYIQNEINSFLKLNGKRLIVFIDNLDRANSDNVIFLLKLVATVFNFNNTVYVLSYDADRMQEIMRDTLKIDPRYMEKIIQQEISLPEISVETRREVFVSCFNNILTCYGVNSTQQSAYNRILENVAGNIPNMRSYKRFINSVLPVVFASNDYLYKFDFLALESIRFLNLELYNEIFENKKYFVTHDAHIDYECYVAQSQRDFDKHSKEFASRLIERYDSSLLQLLALVFPQMHEDAYHPGISRKNDEISQLKCARSAKYFDLYFTFNSNIYSSINDDVKEFVCKLNAGKQTAEKHFIDVLKTLDAETQKEWLEILQLHLELINSNVLIPLAKMIADHMELTNNQMFFAQSNAQTRAVYIVSIICEKCTEKELSDFMCYMQTDYRKIRTLGRMMHVMQQESEAKENLIARYELIKHTLEKVCASIIEQKIDVYQDTWYFPGGIWSLIWYLDNVHKEYTISDYIEEFISGENVYRILGDMIRQHLGNQYGYSIPDDTFSKFIKSPETIDRLLEKSLPKTESELFVKRIYEAHKNGTPDDFGDKVVGSDIPINLNL